MNAIQQKCRPKHQVLVLKCYPRTTKGAVDVKPNSSELSYLLYYATSRRSKIQKIGAFLEKKTATDVWRMRIGNVQVTLGILAALVEKSPKDAALIAPCILKILELILRSNDITMIESSLPTWEAFCEHHEVSSLFADQSYLTHYESVVRAYAHLASTHDSPGKATNSRPMQVRWRNAGLNAIRCIATSDALASTIGRQINVILPMILENLWAQDVNLLDVLLHRVEAEEKVDSEKLLRRRMSIATVQTNEDGDTNPLAISGTALDVDKMAEEDTAVLAMQCLKAIFVVPNRSQIYTATQALLNFISEQANQREDATARGGEKPGEHSEWAVKIFNIIARWAPVQDRYIILVVALDTLSHTPMRDDSLPQHMALTTMIESLLRSDINLIGLSVMDVLLGLIKQIRKLFQLFNIGSRADTPTSDRTDSEKEQGTRQQRQELLARIEQCIADLAGHIYYADQISDMIAAILGRLRPGRPSSTTSTPQGEKTEGNEPVVSSPSVADLTESQTSHTDAYFSYNAGRISALRVVKAILYVANPKSNPSSNMELNRNRVPVKVWEGTQWLLRDSDGHIRKAYADALITWLDLETTRTDLIARDETFDFHHRPSVKSNRDGSRRVVSNNSNKERSNRGRRSQFLPQIHLSIYDNALHFVEYDNDITLLHSLLTKLVFRLGVNSVRYGVPMIYRLQEEVMELEQPIHKVRIAALCHGYFWALTDRFDFETTAVGRAINNEVVRRRSKGFWVDGINVPAPLISQIGQPGRVRPQPHWDPSALETEELLPFDDRNSLIQCIAVGYEENSLSPPTSPAASPGRTLSGPILTSSMGSMVAGDRPVLELPAFCREEMSAEWSRDEVLATLAAEGKAESVTGSRPGTVATGLARLTVGSGMNGNVYIPPSPYGSQHNLRPHSSQAFCDRDQLGHVSKFRQPSVRSGMSPTLSASSKAGVASVEQLKRVLSGTISPGTAGFTPSDDESIDSMVSYDYSPSEKSFSPSTDPDRPGTSGGALKRTMSGNGGPLSSNPPREHSPKLEEEQGEDEIPPVPPLPNLSSLSDKGSLGGGIAIHDFARGPKRNPSGRNGEAFMARPRTAHDHGHKVMDLQELLLGIDSRPGEGSLGNLTKPPY